MKKPYPPPDTIYLVVNSQCNMRCKMCDIGQNNAQGQFYKTMNRNGGILSPSLVYDLLEETSKDKPKIAITGTEPLLYPYLQNVVNRALQKGFEVQITTNGYLLEKHISFIMAEGVQDLWVSLDGPPRVHDAIRGVDGAFERALGTLQKLQNLKERDGKSFPSLSVNFTITDLNQYYLTDFADVMKGRQVHLEQITFCHTNFVTRKMAETHNETWGLKYPASPSGMTGFEPRNIDPTILWEQVGQIKKWGSIPINFSPDLKTRADIEAFYHHPAKFVTGKHCHMAARSAQILADGTLTTSTRCFDLSLGNLGKEPFPKLWQGPKRRAFLSDLARVGAFPACTRCCGIF